MAINLATNVLGLVFDVKTTYARDTLKAFQQTYQGFVQGIIRDTKTLEGATQAAFGVMGKTITDQIRTFQSMVMGGVAVSMAAIGIGRVGRSMIRALSGVQAEAAQLERTLAEIQVRGGMMGRQFERDLSVIQRHVLGLSRTYPIMANEAAQVYLEAVKAGYEASRTFGEELSPAGIIAETVSRFAFAANMEGAEAFRLLDIYRRSVGAAVEDFPALADELLKASDLVKADVQDFLSAFQSLAAATIRLGNVPRQQHLAVLGALMDILQPRRAGMTMAGLARELGSLQVSLMRAMSTGRLDRRAETFIQQILMPPEALELAKRDILSFFSWVISQARLLYGEDAFAVLQQVFQQIGTNALAIIEAVEKSGKSLKDLEREIRSSAGYTETFLRRYMETSEGVLMLTQASLQSMRITIGNTLLPVFRGVYYVVHGLSNVMARLTETFPNLSRVITTSALALGGLLVVGSSLMFVFGGLLSTIASIQVGFLNLSRYELYAMERMYLTGKTIQDALSQLNLLPKALARVQFAGAQFRITFEAIRMMLAPTVASIVRSIYSMARIFTLLYVVWRFDVLRIRSMLTGGFESIRSAMDQSVRLARLSGNQFAEAWGLLTEEQQRGLLGRLTRIRMLARAIGEAFRLREELPEAEGRFAVWWQTLEDLERVGITKRRFGEIMKVIEMAEEVVRAFGEGFEWTTQTIIYWTQRLWDIVRPVFRMMEWSFQKVYGLMARLGLISPPQPGQRPPSLLTSGAKVVGGLTAILLGGAMTRVLWRATLGRFFRAAFPGAAARGPRWFRLLEDPIGTVSGGVWRRILAGIGIGVGAWRQRGLPFSTNPLLRFIRSVPPLRWLWETIIARPMQGRRGQLLFGPTGITKGVGGLFGHGRILDVLLVRPIEWFLKLRGVRFFGRALKGLSRFLGFFSAAFLVWDATQTATEAAELSRAARSPEEARRLVWGRWGRLIGDWGGAIAGSVLGGLLGSVLGPLGTIGGSMLGGSILSWLGGRAGELLGSALAGIVSWFEGLRRRRDQTPPEQNRAESWLRSLFNRTSMVPQTNIPSVPTISPASFGAMNQWSTVAFTAQAMHQAIQPRPAFHQAAAGAGGPTIVIRVEPGAVQVNVSGTPTPETVSTLVEELSDGLWRSIIAKVREETMLRYGSLPFMA